MMMEGSMDLGSVISLRSSGLDHSKSLSNGTQKLQRGRRPLSATGRPYKPASKTAPLKQKTGREMWVAAVQNGGGMSAESLSKSDRSLRLATSQGSGSKFLMEQLIRATGRQMKDTAGYSDQKSSRAAPAYKSQEEYYDEVLDLKKRINALKEERELNKKRMIRVEEENQKQAKTISELLDPNMQTNSMRRAVSSKSKDSSAVISSLQHQVFSLERLLKVKELELSKLKTDMKYTDLHEARIEAEMYHQEAKRLHTEANNDRGLAMASQQLNIDDLRNKPQQMQIALKRLADDNACLVNENRSLKRDLIKAIEPKDGAGTIKDHEDMSRSEMLAKITELEKHLKAAEKIPIDGDKGSPKSASRRGRNDELTIEIDKLKETIVKLKEDRAHYRTISDEYRTEIDRRTASSKHRTDSVTDLNASGKPNLSTQQSRKASVSSASVRKYSTHSDERVSEELSHDEADEFDERRPRKASVTSRLKTKRDPKSKIGNESSIDDDSVAVIQAALRGHAGRQHFIRQRHDTQRRLESRDGQPHTDDDLILVQAALRGHSSRRDALSRERSEHSSRQERHSEPQPYGVSSNRSRPSAQYDGDRYDEREEPTRSTYQDSQYEREQSRSSHAKMSAGVDAISVDRLQQSSRPWSSSHNDRDSDDEADHVFQSGGSSWRDRGNGNSREKTQKSNSRSDGRQGDSSHLKERWGKSKPSNRKPEARRTQFGSDGSVGGDDDDDDDDLVIGSSLASVREKKRPSLLDELF